MIKEFPKQAVVQLTEHFQSVDFNCQCHDPLCTHTLVDTDLVEFVLEPLYERVNDLWVSSGFRCQQHNRIVGGKPGSLHLIGKAADIQSHTKPKDVAALAETLPLIEKGGMGVGNNFVHLDVRGYLARWTY